MAEYENIIDLDKLGRFHNNLKDKGLPLNDWQANKEYKVGYSVKYNNRMYVCNTDHTSGVDFDNDNWDIINSGISIWQANTDYEVNDIVIDDNLIWQCVVAHTSTSTFDESKWEEISGGGIFAWESNKNYKVGIMVVYKYCIYMCKVAHTSTTDFEYNKWIIIGGGGNSDYGDYVGHITWQMSLQSNYLKLDGTPLANASNDYVELLEYAQNNNLITADTTNKSLFKYDITTDVLTLPDYIGLCLQGGNTVEEKEAGLPNITGVSGGGAQWSTTTPSGASDPNSTGVFSDSLFTRNNDAFTYQTQQSGGHLYWISPLDFKASNSNSIYSDSATTVQPPAIQLIPQIRYKYSGCVYSTEEQRIGTWIDGKPLYQRTIQTTTPSVNNVSTVVANIGDDVYMKEVSGYVLQSLDTIPINYIYTVAGSTYYIATMFNKGKCYMNMQGYNDLPAFITIKYTKTTD